MNKCIIIGNLTRDPELRTTQDGVAVCTFKVAVNKRTTKNHPETEYFKVTAWRELGQNCAKFLAKGKKVYVAGPVSVSSYEGKDGNTYMDLEIRADEVEFLSPREKADGVEGEEA